MIDLESVVWAETCHELKDVLGLGGRGCIKFVFQEMAKDEKPKDGGEKHPLDGGDKGLELEGMGVKGVGTLVLLLINDTSSYWYGQSDSFQSTVVLGAQHEKWISFFFYNISYEGFGKY